MGDFCCHLESLGLFRWLQHHLARVKTLLKQETSNLSSLVHDFKAVSHSLRNKGLSALKGQESYPILCPSSWRQSSDSISSCSTKPCLAFPVALPSSPWPGCSRWRQIMEGGAFPVREGCAKGELSLCSLQSWALHPPAFTPALTLVLAPAVLPRRSLHLPPVHMLCSQSLPGFRTSL